MREASPAAEPAYAQSETIRRWANKNGHRLVAVCQDVRTPGYPVGREGLQSIIGIITAGQVDGVVVPSLSTFASDKITQEVIMSLLRATGVALMSADLADVDQLADIPADRSRALVRHVLDKQARFETILTLQAIEPANDEDQQRVVLIDDVPDVVVELVPAEAEAVSVG